MTFSVPTAWSWCAYKGGFHGESVVWCEFFVRVQFDREGLEISVQSFTTFLEFSYGEGGRLEGVNESTGLHGEMYGGVRRQGIVIGNLLLDGSSKSMGEFSS